MAAVTSATSGGGGSSKKAQKCTHCLATIKDMSKGQHCPGCSSLFCWRCERKYFQVCPNETDCVHPLRRCADCTFGRTMTRVVAQEGLADEKTRKGLGNGRDRISNESFRAFSLFIEGDEKLSIEANPFIRCGSNGCWENECISCFSDSRKRLLCCSKCDKVRCRFCCQSSLDNSAACKELERLTSRKFLSSAEIAYYAEKLVRTSPDAVMKCELCEEDYCYECVGEVEVRAWAKKFRYGVNGIQEKCERCYWSDKPCTNPNCPNEVGVPTKRCGDCHRARYCSKQCQIAAYPMHQDKCRKLKEKRAAREVGGNGG